MTETARCALLAAALAIAGCGDARTADDTSGGAGKAAPAAHSDEIGPPRPTAETQPAPDAERWQDEDVVWADEAFLAEAGVKQGKDVIYLPTPPMVADKMVEMAQIRKGDVVWDLGTGDGRIAIAAARKTGARTVGFEIDEALVAVARDHVRKAGLEDLVTIEQKDVLTLDFSEPDVVLMFLNPDLNVKLLPLFDRLKPGARVVSHDFDMKGLVEPDLVIENFRSKVPDFVNIHNLYLWKAPLEQKQ